MEPRHRAALPGARTYGTGHLVVEGPCRYGLKRAGAMRVPGIVFTSDALLAAADDRTLDQVANVATLPGIVEASYAMPDVHWGYGFPIGGVAATDVAAGGVVSPGGVGFDISCGVRLLLAPLTEDELAPSITALMDELDRVVPRGLGRGGGWHLDSMAELELLLSGGAVYAVEAGRGVARDLERCEDHGCLPGVRPDAVSERARERGLDQVGSLGSGNHFLEIQVVDRVFDATTAAAFGLALGQVTVMIHCGSRGLGHQICSDHVRAMLPMLARSHIELPDPQLACAPVDSREGRAYLAAMAAAANYGRANRQVLTEAARGAFAHIFGTGQLDLVYDISHNLAKLEDHVIDGELRRLCVHRKGATRALPPGHPDLPPALRPYGQPVFLPGSMGTASYVLVGAEHGAAFHSAAHGAGRVMSRHAARRRSGARQVRAELTRAGVVARASSAAGLVEEAPFAYKDVDEVARVCEVAGLARRVARVRPVGVVKG